VTKNVAVGTFVVKGPRKRYDSSLRVIAGLQFSKIEIILTAYRELVGDSRMGTAIGTRSRYMF
jgi:hypothetical protein